MAYPTGKSIEGSLRLDFDRRRSSSSVDELFTSHLHANK